AIPSGCSIEVRSVSSPLPLTTADLDLLPASAWSVAAVATAMEPRRGAGPRDCAWDALIAALPGRYLWLALVVKGDGRQTPCLSSVLVEYPRVTLRRYLPAVFGFDPAGAEFTDRFTAIFDRTLRSIEQPLDE